jgi:hypothetical protein
MFWHNLLEVINDDSVHKTINAMDHNIVSKIRTHDGVASIHREGILQKVAAFLTGLVTRVNHPTVSLHQNGGTEVSTENTTIENQAIPIYKLSKVRNYYLSLFHQ